MRVLLIEDDRTTAQSVELMLKAEKFNLYITDLGEEGVDLGKVYATSELVPATSELCKCGLCGRLPSPS
jgi:DNA-binding response OmpR family regulator